MGGREICPHCRKPIVTLAAIDRWMALPRRDVSWIDQMCWSAAECELEAVRAGSI